MIATVQATWRMVRAKVVSSQFARHVGILTVANFVNALLNFIQGILVARWLGPELYGIAALIMSFPSLVYTFFDARSSEASVKYLSEFHARGERERALATCKMGYIVDFAIAFVAFLAVLVMSPWAARNIVHRPETVGLFVLYAAAFVPRAFVGSSYAVLATLGRFPLIAILDTSTTILRTVLILGLVLSGWRVAGVIWGNAVATAVMGMLYGIIGYILVRQSWGGSWLSGRWQDLKGYRRAIVSFLAYNDLNALLGMIPKQLDIVLLGYFRNPTEAGYYKLAKSLAGVVSYLVGPLQSVTYPQLVQMQTTENRLAFRRKIKQLLTRVGLPLGCVFFIIGIIFASMLPVLVGRSYVRAVAILQLFFLLAAWQTLFFWLRPAYMAIGKIKFFAFVSTVFTGVLVLGWVLATAQFGALGITVTTLLVSLGHVSYLTSWMFLRVH